MRVLVCGGRDYHDYHAMVKILREYPKDTTTFVQGGARGADHWCRMFCLEFGYEFEEYRAQWEKYGNSAGPIRNQQMLEEGKPDLVIAFPGGKGTAHMIKIAREAGVKVIEVSGETPKQ